MTGTTIHMVRHAAHADVGVALTGRGAGVRLTSSGRADAARLASRFGAVGLDAVYASPRERARDTAEPIAAASGRAVVVAEALDEIDFGEWTGALFADLARDPRWERWNRARAAGCPPGGEPMAAAQARVADQLQAWCGVHSGGRIVAVSHADVIKAALCGVLGLSLDHVHALDVEPASVSTIVAWPGGGKVVGLNAAGPA